MTGKTLWVDRPPTEEELEGQRRAAEEAAAARAALIDRVVADRAAPDALLRSMGRITIAELNTRVAAIRAQVEAETP